MDHGTARVEIAPADPALPSGLAACLQSPTPYTAERYPSRLFLAERHAGIAAEPTPRAARRVEYFVLNLFCGRRRAGDVQAQ
eukprot:1446492-Pyramimonas_sp.AAC.1